MREALVQRARSLRPSPRAAFLAQFDAPVPQGPAAEIQAEVDRFVEAVAGLPPQDGWHHRRGWREDEHEEPSAEVAQAEDLLVAIGERFLAGEVAWAMTAYEQVISTIVDLFDDDRGIDLSVDPDLASEAVGRWLWSLAWSSPAESAAPSLDDYRWAVDHLAAGGERQRAVEVAEEALEHAGSTWPAADLADIAAALWRSLDRPDQAYAAQQRSWSARPTVLALELLLDDGDHSGQTAVAGVLAADLPRDRFLAAAVALLAGDLDRAIGAITKPGASPSVSGWAPHQLVGAACCLVASGPQSLVAPIVEAATGRGELQGQRGSWPVQVPTLERTPPTPLAVRVLSAISSIETDHTRLADARRIVDAVADQVLGSTARARYATVAELVVLLAHTTQAAEGTDPSTVVEEYDLRYRRFSAFRAELRTAMSAASERLSRALSDPPGTL